MIDITELNAKLVAQDEALRARFVQILKQVEEQATTRPLAEMLAEGLAAIHERQGNLITLMLQTSV